MNFRNPLLASSVTAALLIAAPALAQSLSAGATVTGPQGAAVGTLASVEGDFVVLKTDRHEVRLPAASFTATDDGKVLFSMSRDQVNAAVEAQLAQAAQVIVVGALVRDSAGIVVGPIEEVAADAVIVKVDENLVRLPKAAVAPGPSGPVVAVTLAEIRAQTAAPAPVAEGTANAPAGVVDGESAE